MHDDHVAPSSAGDARDRLIAMNPLDLFMNETDRELSRDQGTRQRGTDSSRCSLLYTGNSSRDYLQIPRYWRYARGIYDIWRFSNASISRRTMP